MRCHASWLHRPTGLKRQRSPLRSRQFCYVGICYVSYSVHEDHCERGTSAMAPSRPTDATWCNHEELVARYALTLTSNHIRRPMRTTNAWHTRAHLKGRSVERKFHQQGSRLQTLQGWPPLRLLPASNPNCVRGVHDDVCRRVRHCGTGNTSCCVGDSCCPSLPSANRSWHW